MIRVIIAGLMMVLSALAQNGIRLSGTVTDPDGYAVPDARILLYRHDNPGRSTAASDGEGNFTFDRLQPGRFVIEVDKRGFGGRSSSIDITNESEQRIEIELSVQGVSQSVVVTATDTPMMMDEIAKSVSVISSDEVQNRNEYSLGEALRTVPGMQVLNLGGPGQQTTIRTRGLRSDATAVLVDGLRFRDPSSTQSDASALFSGRKFVGAERVEVLRGSGSALYGTNAVGGVVNVITGDGGSPTRVSLLTEGGGLGLFRGRASVGGGALQDRLRYSGSLLHLNVVNGVDGNDAARSTGAQGFVRYDFTPAINLTGRIWASDDFVQTNSGPTTTGIPNANFPDQTEIPVRMMSPQNVRLFLAGGQPDYTGVTLIPGRDDPDARRTTRFSTTALVFRQAFTPRVNWQTSYQRVHSNRVFADGPGGSGFQPEANSFSRFVGDIDTLDVRASALVSSWFTVIGGYEFERESYFDKQDNNLPGTSRVATETNIRQDTNAGWFSSQLSFLDRRLQVVASGRSQFFSLSRPRFVTAGVANNYETVPLNAPPKALTGDLSVSYLISATSTKLRAHTGNTYRSPSLYERFGGGFGSVPATGEISFTPYGDPRLSPDRYNNVDAGIDQYLFNSRVRASATWFYSRVVTVTEFDFSGGIDPTTDPFGRFIGYINGSGGISRGVELGIEAKPTRSTIVNVAYTHVNATQDRDLSVPGFFRPARVHDHVTSFVVSHDWTRRLNTTVDHIYMSQAYDFYFAAGGSRAFVNPGFQKTDAVVSFLVWEDERRSARLYGKVDNLFDNTYYHAGWLAPGATGLAGIQFQF